MESYLFETSMSFKGTFVNRKLIHARAETICFGSIKEVKAYSAIKKLMKAHAGTIIFPRIKEARGTFGDQDSD